MRKNSQNLFLHADGDSFFVACELIENPKYKGLPVIVGEDKGIAVAMSHEAKKLGVTRGMPIFKIKKCFPEVIILSHHFDLYKKISEGVYDIISSYLTNVERYSIDECFAIVKQSDIKFAGSTEKLVKAIKDEIDKKLGVTFSFGLARTKALAKTASKLEKPNGLVILMNELEEVEALKRTPINDVWGIGRQTVPNLMRMGIKTAYDFINYPSEQIEKNFSEQLFILQKELSGRSYYDVNSDSDPRDQKSIQSTATFKPSTSDPKIIFTELSENIEHACEHARKLDLMTNHISFFIKNTNFIHRTGDVHLPVFTTNPGIMLNSIEPEFYKVIKNGEKIRSTGVTFKSLRRSEDVPKDLFGIQEKSQTRDIIERVGDSIRKKFGHNALKHASSFKRIQD